MLGIEPKYVMGLRSKNEDNNKSKNKIKYDK